MIVILHIHAHKKVYAIIWIFKFDFYGFDKHCNIYSLIVESDEVNKWTYLKQKKEWITSNFKRGKVILYISFFYIELGNYYVGLKTTVMAQFSK